MKAAAECAGLSRSLRTYDLRHTYASLLIAAGAHPKVVQERLGHKTITMTFDVYGHLFPALDEQITGRLDAMHLAVDWNACTGAGVPQVELD